MTCPGCGADMLDTATACRWVGRVVDHPLREGLLCTESRTFYLDHPRA